MTAASAVRMSRARPLHVACRRWQVARRGTAQAPVLGDQNVFRVAVFVPHLVIFDEGSLNNLEGSLRGDVPRSPHTGGLLIRHAPDVTRRCNRNLYCERMGRRANAGRPSKGERQLLGTRPAQTMADAAHSRANELGLTMSDYLISLLAKDLGMPELSVVSPSTNKELHIPAA